MAYRLGHVGLRISAGCREGDLGQIETPCSAGGDAGLDLGRARSRLGGGFRPSAEVRRARGARAGSACSTQEDGFRFGDWVTQQRGETPPGHS